MSKAIGDGTLKSIRIGGKIIVVINALGVLALLAIGGLEWACIQDKLDRSERASVTLGPLEHSDGDNDRN